MFSGSSSSTSTSTLTSTSTSTPQIDPMILAYIDQKVKPKTPQQMQVQNNHQIKIGLLYLVGFLLIGIIVFCAYVYAIDKEDGKAFMHQVLPIISATITGIIGYFVGEKRTKN